MQRFVLIFITCTLLFGALASRQVFRCSGSRCGNETSIACATANHGGSGPASLQAPCGQKQGSPKTCCFCCVNCCDYLLPLVDFRLRIHASGWQEDPVGLQHWYAQLFYHRVWRPPAQYASIPDGPQNHIHSNIKNQIT
jgi:hypothetical protein